MRFAIIYAEVRYMKKLVILHIEKYIRNDFSK